MHFLFHEAHHDPECDGWCDQCHTLKEFVLNDFDGCLVSFDYYPPNTPDQPGVSSPHHGRLAALLYVLAVLANEHELLGDGLVAFIFDMDSYNLIPEPRT